MLGLGSGMGRLPAHQLAREHCCHLLCSAHITAVGMGSEVLSFQVQLLITDHNTSYGMEPPGKENALWLPGRVFLGQGNDWVGGGGQCGGEEAGEY